MSKFHARLFWNMQPQEPSSIYHLSRRLTSSSPPTPNNNKSTTIHHVRSFWSWSQKWKCEHEWATRASTCRVPNQASTRFSSTCGSTCGARGCKQRICSRCIHRACFWPEIFDLKMKMSLFSSLRRLQVTYKHFSSVRTYLSDAYRWGNDQIKPSKIMFFTLGTSCPKI